MAVTPKRPSSKDEAAAPPAVSSEGPATPPEKPATPPEAPATPPSDGERSPEDRAGDVELSKSVTGDQPAPDGEVRFAPVERYVLDRKEPIRAGGYVCTDHGWVLDPDGAPDSTETTEKG